MGDDGASERTEATSEVERLRTELVRERERTRALEDIGIALGSTLDLTELLALLLERVAKVTGADRSTLYLLDEEAGELRSRVVQGSGEALEIRLKVGEGLAGWVAKNGRPINIKDAYKDVRFDAEWDRRSGYRTRSILGVPMKNHLGRTIGVIQVLNKKEAYFTLDDEAMLGAIASQAAVSIENSKLFLSVIGKNMELLDAKEQLERKIRELDVLFEIAQVAASAMRLDDLLEGVLARAIRAIDAEAGSILIAEEGSGDLRFRAAVGGEPSKVRNLRIKAGQGISGWVAYEQKPQVVNEVDDDGRHSREIADRVGYHPRTVLCVPLRWEDGVGALELLNKERGRGAFTEEDMKLASVIAGHVSNAIGLAQSREKREREERLGAIGQLLSSVLHDLKTPMTVVNGFVQLMAIEPSEEARKRYADAVLRQVRLVNAMTREILAFARGERTILSSKVYLHKFFEEVREQLDHEMAERGIKVELDLRDRGVAHFDAAKIQRALHNLARNAAEAIEGSGRVGGTFHIVVDRREDGALVLRCEDDGPGIPAEIRGKLFESFTSHGKKGGTGLGLAIVRKVAEDHGGTIDVESEPGKTVFTIVLPQRFDPPSTERALPSDTDRPTPA